MVIDPGLKLKPGDFEINADRLDIQFDPIPIESPDRMAPWKIHFPSLNPNDDPIDLVTSLRVGGRAQPQGPEGPDRDRFKELNERAAEFFVSAPLEQAQVAFYPYRISDSPQARDAAEQAKQRGIDCLFLDWGDETQPYSIPYGAVFRHSLYSDQRQPTERAYPAYCPDPLAGADWSPSEIQSKPSVGFCGFVSNPLVRALYRASGRKRKVDGLQLRADAMRALRRSPRVRTDFICRQNYWAGAAGRFHHNVDAQHKARQAFLKNLLDCDYTLCVRGAGNFSYRFYEVLGAGRIPLFINTRCVLPFDDEIDWRNHCVWVEADNIRSAADILADFHASVSKEKIAQIQQSNRNLWRESLTPLGFYKRIISRAATHPGSLSRPPG